MVPRLGTVSFRPGNRQFLGLVLVQSFVPRLRTASSNLEEPEVLAKVTYGSQLWKHEFHPRVTGSCLQV